MNAIATKLLSPFAPPVRTIRHYSWHKLRKDVVAGLTVSVVEVPQSMAYALIAGVPPQYGLYTSIIQGVIGAMLSSSEHLTTGPTNTQSLLIASTVTRLAGVGSPMYLELVFALTLLKGLIQLGFAAARMGVMVRYVSRAVICGVAAGAGVLIIIGQMGNFLGVNTSAAHSILPGVLGTLSKVGQNLSGINVRSVIVGLVVMAFVIVGRKISRFVPGALIGVTLAAGVAVACGWESGDLPLVGELPRAFPSFHIPQVTLEQAEALIGGAVALGLLGMLESVAIVKAIATHTGERIDPNQEFFAQGLKNTLSSFLQCIPGSGSFTRSALDYEAGAETRLAAVYNAMFVGVIFWFLAAQAKYIPLASLAGVLFMIALGLIDWRDIRKLAAANRSDFAVLAVTFLATILALLQYAIFIGVLLNIGLYLHRATRLHMAEMVQVSRGQFIEQPLRDRFGGRPVMFIQVEGDLFFGVADDLQERLTQLLRSDVRVVIFRLKRTHSIDSTVLAVLEEFVKEMHEHSRHVVLCGARMELMRSLRAYGLIDLIGKDNVFESGQGVFAAARKALDRAKKLLGSSIDTTGLDIEDEPETFTYQI